MRVGQGGVGTRRRKRRRADQNKKKAMEIMDRMEKEKEKKRERREAKICTRYEVYIHTGIPGTWYIFLERGRAGRTATHLQ